MYPIDRGWRVRNDAGLYLNFRWIFFARWTEPGLIFKERAEAEKQQRKHGGEVVPYFGDRHRAAIAARASSEHQSSTCSPMSFQSSTR